ncbi:MAG: hypothetical protein KDA28_00550, partial [Phycisphaerales bacterium]|nr:hypothetical protein [Phycisphaerales bacterium]
MMRQASRQADVGILLAAALLVGVIPTLVVGIGIPSSTLPDPERLLRTILYPLGVGVLATILAMPLASWMRSRMAWWALLPMLVPSYLAYVGWGVLRSPDLPTGVWLAGAGLQREAGIALAVFGLSLWATPLGAIAQALLLERSSVRDHLRLDAPWSRRAWTLVALRGRGLATSVLLVSLVMLGSSVPFHLAQVDTWAIRLWFRTQEEPLANVVADAWPLVPPVALASIWLARRAGSRLELDTTTTRASRLGWGVLALGVLVPAALLAFLLHEPRA